mmetsp:Transcript_109714/g.310362  ORF Transcript_109714/g.310362 Transcript_109714/m.310362 type:complete len:212 (+) Transcript_109714:671-1306(+)
MGWPDDDWRLRQLDPSLACQVCRIARTSGGRRARGSARTSGRRRARGGRGWERRRAHQLAAHARLPQVPRLPRGHVARGLPVRERPGRDRRHHRRQRENLLLLSRDTLQYAREQPQGALYLDSVRPHAPGEGEGRLQSAAHTPELLASHQPPHRGAEAPHRVSSNPHDLQGGRGGRGRDDGGLAGGGVPPPHRRPRGLVLQLRVGGRGSAR